MARHGVKLSQGCNQLLHPNRPHARPVRREAGQRLWRRCVKRNVSVDSKSPQQRAQIRFAAFAEIGQQHGKLRSGKGRGFGEARIVVILARQQR